MLKNAPHVDYDPNEKLWTLKRGQNEVLFDSLVMAVAFGDPLRYEYEDSALAVVGRQTDDTVCILYVYGGMWNDVKRRTIDVKDRFYIRKVLLPEDPERMVDELRLVEGLTRYKKGVIEGSQSSRQDYVTPTDSWPEFRSHDLRASLMFVDEEIIKDLGTSWIKLDELLKDGRVTVWPGCLFTAIMIQEGASVKEGLYDSRIRAVLYALEAVLPKDRHRYVDRHEPKPWYSG